MQPLKLLCLVLGMITGAHFAHSQIFQDDIMNETTGTFPSKWKVGDGTALVNVSPMGEKAIELEHLSYVHPIVNGQTEGYLGQEFTITFKVYFNEEQYVGRQEYTIRLWKGNNYANGKMRMMPITLRRNGASTGYFNPDQKSVNKYFPSDTPQNGYNPQTKTFKGMWRTVKLTYQDGALSLYLDDIPVFVIPKIPLEPSMVSIGAIEKWRQARDYFTAFRDVAIFNSANPAPVEMGCDALRMALIDGKWEIEDPSGSLEGLVVNLKRDIGLVSTPGNSKFEKADHFWKNIKPMGDDFYEFEQADINGDSWTGVIQRHNIDEMRVAYEGVSGTEISHVWHRVRKYYDGAIGNPNESGNEGSTGSGDWPKELPAMINESTILTPGPLGEAVHYYTDRIVDIDNYFEIPPGTIIEFGENGGLGVYGNGWLIVNGVSSSPVVLKGKDGKSWRGIHIDTDKENGIYGTTIDNGGRNYVYCCDEKASVFVKDGGTLTISDSTISNSQGCGVYIKEGGRISLFNNTYMGNQDGDVCNED